MAHARPFWTSTLQELSNGIKNTSMQGVLALAVTFFGSLGRLPSPIFESVSGDLTLPQSGVATERDKELCFTFFKTNACT